MSNRQTPPFSYPMPPADYDRRYFSDLVRIFAFFLNNLLNPGEMRGTRLVLTDLPTSDSGLEPGTLFSHQGTVTVSTLYRAYPDPQSVSVGVGSVTVTTS